MAGSATLNATLVDELVPTVDELRGDLHGDFGVRQYRVFIVKRRYPGECIGDGPPAILSETEILPRPLVLQQPGVKFKLGPVGMEREGEIEVQEVSLSYTEADLTGQPVANNEEIYYRLDEGESQEMASKFFVLAADPEPDRIKTIGWILKLRRAQVTE
jgi:hypothetical protein